MLRFYKYFMFSITRNFFQAITSDNFTIFWLIFIKYVAWKASKHCPHTADVNVNVLLKSKVENNQYILLVVPILHFPQRHTHFLSIILIPTISSYTMINLVEENRFKSKNFFLLIHESWNVHRKKTREKKNRSICIKQF